MSTAKVANISNLAGKKTIATDDIAFGILGWITML